MLLSVFPFDKEQGSHWYSLRSLQNDHTIRSTNELGNLINMFHRLRMYICLDDIYTLSTRYLHDIYIYMFTRYLDYVYTISTLYLHYIYTTSVHIYMSTRCLHDIYSMSTYIYVYTLSTRYLYYVCTYDLHYISTM